MFKRRSRSTDDVKEHAMADAVFIVALAAVALALYAAMFIGLYRWSHYDPLLPADSATVARAYTLIP